VINITEITIISGGQSGVDRAALDFALHNKLPCGGWCPKDRWAEDGRIPDKYPVRETDSVDPRVRTKKNILQCDGTLVLHGGELDEGTAFTIESCIINDKPVLELDLSEQFDLGRAQRWLSENNIQTLNVAGPRESKAPGIYAVTRKFLQLLYDSLQ